MTVTEARVIRSGGVRKIPSVELVPGDIVLLQSGEKVPADLRLIRCRDLQIDESTLTGESLPVDKISAALADDVVLADRRNLAFSSTLVTHGQGTGVVFATGGQTEVGRISELVSTAEMLETPLTRKIARFSRLLLVAILVLASLTFVIGILRGQAAFEMFMAAVALAVGAIPEGLPAAVTITLAIGVSRMAKRRAIIRKLPAVETLGSTMTICSDKTGTLTVNQMTVRTLWAAGDGYQLSGSGYAPDGEVTAVHGGGAWETNVAARQCLLAGLLCNDSSVQQGPEGWDVNGDPTEGALIVAAMKAGLHPEQTSTRFRRIDAIPFESEYQYMASLHQSGEPDGNLLYVKGAWEVIRSKCVAALAADGQSVPLDAETVQAELERMASEGLRVLAFARRQVPGDVVQVEHADVAQLIFVGLQGMIDPPRPEAIAAVRACQRAGIRVKMITGDHPATAQAIAEKLGIDGAAANGQQPPTVMTSVDLASTSDQRLIETAERVAIFARVTPEQKLRLVRALQASDQVVAMTGDGVNDAPALKQADIGVAMGAGGTEVAKEAADMILTDDNFATIEAAVEEGRGIFDNLTKFIVWTLPTNMGEGLVILTAIVAGVTLPLLPVQILWINMTTAVLLGLMLAFEPKEPDVMQRTPRDPQAPILGGDLILRICIVAAIMLLGAFGSFEWALGRGYSDDVARTVAVNVFVVVEIFYLFNCRSLTKSMFTLGVFTNRWIAVGVSTMIALQLTFTYAPLMNRLFHSAPIGWDAWWRILLSGASAYIVVGGEKAARRRWRSRRSTSERPAAEATE
jgi:Ca2+-transporting ATPase